MHVHLATHECTTSGHMSLVSNEHSCLQLLYIVWTQSKWIQSSSSCFTAHYLYVIKLQSPLGALPAGSYAFSQ